MAVSWRHLALMKVIEYATQTFTKPVGIISQNLLLGHTNQWTSRVIGNGQQAHKETSSQL